ncbi:MAG: RecQ family ATP-dependent DNA helicase [Methanocorpusculum sp.]|nr:RecQ family ATP-dependent DNA helicase [Methanocorpusculum sp.]
MKQSEPDIQDTLEKYFHLQEFRPNQQEIIKSIVKGRDVLAVMATGGGKSLCYQLPALMSSGMAVVISPLIALMKDQVDALSAQGVHVGTLNSSLSYDRQRKVEAEMLAGDLRILYVSPERAVQADFVSILEQCNVSLFAVDEAHCISMWGHQFRPEYRRIKGLRAFFPGVPFAAFTATATRRVRDDIISELKLANPAVFVGSFDRPNLRYAVYKEPHKEVRMKKIASYVAAHKNVSGIVYCFTRADCEEMAAYLLKSQILACPYHAGMSTKDRARVQEMFQSNAVSVVCATIAFGMGIDKPDVRYVVHAHMPKDLESYYQETGRAGRDGLPADCVLFYSAGDRAKLLRMMEKEGEEGAGRVNLPALRERLAQLYAYCETRECRRKVLLGYFDEVKDNCGNCDNCAANKRRPSKKTASKKEVLPKDMTDEIVYAVGELEGMLTAQEFVSFLIGLDRLKTKTLGLRRHSAYGIAKYYQRSAVTNTVEALIEAGRLRLEGTTIQRVYSGKGRK